MNDLLSKSLARIVTENHNTAAVFEKYDLDFCCNGRRTLEEACREKKLDPADLLLELEKTGEEKTGDASDTSQLPLHELTDLIEDRHHRYVRRELPLIRDYLLSLVSRHGEKHPELHKILELFAAIKEEMEMHMMKEEQILFPRIREIERMVTENLPLQISPAFIGAPASMMEQEHDHAGSLMAGIRELSNNYRPPADACTTYTLCYSALQAFESDLHRHVHLENNILFPRALQLFSNTDAELLN